MPDDLAEGVVHVGFRRLIAAEFCNFQKPLPAIWVGWTEDDPDGNRLSFIHLLILSHPYGGAQADFTPENGETTMLRLLALSAALLFPGLAVAQNLEFAAQTQFHRFIDEFDNFEADQWIITTTEAGAGDATEAVADADGGILVITNDAADNDLDFLQWSGDDDSGTAETFTFTAGKRLYFEARLKVSEATQLDWIMGLQVTDTTALAVSDGIWFQKDDGDAFLDVHVAASSTQTNLTAVHTVVADTYMKLGLYYDGSDDNIQVYVDGVSVGSIAITNAPSTELTLSFGVQNGEATADLMSVDYIAVWKEREFVE